MAGAVSPPIPFAASATMRNGARASMSTKECTCSAKAASASSRLDSDPGAPTGGSPASVSALIRPRPVSSPTGLAPARHSLIPLYCAGLCDAVSMAPGASYSPAAQNSRSVEARPRWTTSRPWPITPSANAAANSGPEGRMSWATSTWSAPEVSAAKRAKAAPMRRTSGRVELFGDDAPDVVGLEDGIEGRGVGVGHRADTS